MSGPAPIASIEPNERVTFRIVHEDEHVLVVEKPARLAVQPGKGHTRDTLLNGLFASHGAKLQNVGRARDFGLVHRLDRDTSGLLLVALTPGAYDSLRGAFEKRSVSKYYWAVCARAPEKESGVIRLAIAETRGGEERSSKVRTAHVDKRGKPALTAYRVIERSELAALIEARPVTGRLHQVRVHLTAIGAPILGDEFYGPKTATTASPRLALHAHRIVFDHPVTGEKMDVRAGFPKDLRRVLRAMRLSVPAG